MDSTVTELQSEMEKGNLTSVQLTQMYVDRIEAYDNELDLNSVIAINPDAFSEALEMDLERSGGLVRGPLHGIPVIVNTCVVYIRACGNLKPVIFRIIHEKVKVYIPIQFLIDGF